MGEDTLLPLCLTLAYGFIPFPVTEDAVLDSHFMHDLLGFNCSFT